MKTTKILLALNLIALILLIVFVWLHDNSFPMQLFKDPIEQKSEPYLDKIILNNETIRAKSISIVLDCPTANKECYVAKIYEYVVKNYTYIPDPRTADYIQSPFETIELGRGDCEDLTILLISLLENVGIKTYFVETENLSHVYALACVDDPLELNNYQEINVDITLPDDIYSEKYENKSIKVGEIPANYRPISTYKIEYNVCVPLETTAGKYGWVGYVPNITERKIALDPKSRKYVYF